MKTLQDIDTARRRWDETKKETLSKVLPSVLKTECHESIIPSGECVDL